MIRIKPGKFDPKLEAIRIKAFAIWQNDFNARHGLPPVKEADLLKEANDYNRRHGLPPITGADLQ